ncbi:MAG: ATP-dependent DNA ligase [Acidimicrobiia bacterium]|nr:ATP-dependent DNA ligase [Acidimicrobiia bacterium]
MLLSEVVATSKRVAATRSRRTKVSELAAAIAQASPDEVPIVVGFLSGEPRQGRVGVGWASVADVAVEPADQPELTVGDVDEFFASVPTMTGPGSQQARRDALGSLMARATDDEQRFIAALVGGEVRHGALEGLVLEAVATAFDVDTGLVRRAAMLGGGLGDVARIACVDGADGLAAIGLEVLRPIRPMLAATAADAGSAVAELGDVFVDWKLDGARIQVHRSADQVRVFTRNLNDVTERLPEVVEAVLGLDVDAAVLDGESLALDDEGTPRRFGETMSRFGTEQPGGDVALRPFFFDVLHLDGRDLIDLPLSERIELLASVVPADLRVPSLRTSDPEVAEAELERAVGAGYEGIMVKDAASPYEAGRRGSAWRKVKPVYTLDLVVLAAEWGHGRRTGWLSNLHLGCREPESGGFVMLGKTFKGLTDEMLGWQTDRLLELETRRVRNTVFVRPELVVEVALDGLVPSPRYPAGMALRFARVKGYRPDKTAEEADTVEAVRAIYHRRPVQ